MIKFLKWAGLFLLALAALVVILGWILHKPLPKGTSGEAADQLAREMMEAVNKTAWDSTRWVRWTFMGMHDYVWEKERHLVEVRWEGSRVLLDPNAISGKAWQGEEPLSGKARDEAVKKAYGFFCNDSFWLNAVVKAFDPGTERFLVKRNEGEQALLVQYNSGGVTPGDAYLWLLDENNRPYAWQMWVSVLPIGGIETSWSQWDTLQTGALVATWHGGSLGKDLGVRIQNLQGGMDLSSVGLERDPFAEW